MPPHRRYFLFSALLGTLAPLADMLPSRAEQQADPGKLVVIRHGNLPIILSAPHGGRMPIPGVPDRADKDKKQFAVVLDTNTDELALKAAAELERKLGASPYVVVAQFARKSADANRPADGAYESELAKPEYDAYHAALASACAEVRKKWGRGLLLDIHGQAAEVDTIFRGTAGGKSLTALAERYGKPALTGPSSLTGLLEKSGYHVDPGTEGAQTENPRFGGGYIVQTYGSHRGTAIDAMQLEFGTRLRSRDRVGHTAEDLAAAVAIFAHTYLPAAPLPDKS